MLEHIAAAVVAHAIYEGSKKALAAAFEHVKKTRPDIEAKAQTAQTPAEIERVFKEAVGVIIAEADKGQISIDGAAMQALRGIKFDHQQGTVTIGNSTVAADVLITGGSAGATGETTVGENTRLASRGTGVKVGKGAAIKITGGASIKQT